MKLITCERCGKQELRNTKARFCLDCSNERRKEMSTQSMRRLRDGIPNIKRCKRCGKEFTAKGNQQYCSAECANQAKHEQYRDWYFRAVAERRQKNDLCKLR